MKQKTTANGDYAYTTIVPGALSEAQADSRRLLKKGEMAWVASVSNRTLDELIKAKKIPVIKISPRCHRFDPVAVLAALKRFEVAEVKLR
jgi:hypothetical protein